MNNSANGSVVLLDLNVDEGQFDFATSIQDAMIRADAEIASLNETIQSFENIKPQCDKLDYILAASSGALCGVIDIFLVGKPGESPIGNITDKWFADRTRDFAKLCDPEHREFGDLSSALKFLEEKFKIPYDQTGLHGASREVFDLTPSNHHFKSLAHNPSLVGLFFSILDQFSNTSHFVTDGELISLIDAKPGWELKGNNIPAKLFCGLVNWVGHLISDVSGSSTSAAKGNRGTGLPSPLWTWTNDIIAIKRSLNLPVSETDKSMNQLALDIFKQGYDTRFQTAQAIPVFINELLVRFIYSIRRLFRYFKETPKEDRSFSLLWKKCEPFSNPTVKRMLTVAHGTFCLVDIGEAVGRGFATGGGSFNVVEFVLRLNVVGVGRFTISLYGEARRAISYSHAKRDAEFASRKITIVNNYIEGLKILSLKYNDETLLTFIADLKKSDAYKLAFEKSVALAELRGVSDSKILKNKSDIDNYFGGNKNGKKAN